MNKTKMDRSSSDSEQELSDQHEPVQHEPVQHQDLVNMSMQEIQALRSKMGIKRFNEKYNMGKGGRIKKYTSTTQRKSRPLEMSSKHPVPIQPVNHTKKKVTRDPRFDDLSGSYNEEQFKRSYKFIDKIKAKEFKNIKKIAENEDLDEETRQKATDMLTRLGQRKKAKKTVSAEAKVESQLKAERKQALQDGKKPYFVKKAEKKKLVLAEQYKELKKKGQLESFMKKKRKQNAEKSDISKPKRTSRS